MKFISQIRKRTGKDDFSLGIGLSFKEIKHLPGSKLRYILGIKFPFSRQGGFAFNLSFPDQL